MSTARCWVCGELRVRNGHMVHPYPDMPTARSRCSAVVYNEWLAVAGGWGGLSSVEVMNTDSKQWYAAPPTPTPWSGMGTAIVGDTCYFMGGNTGEALASTATTEAYSVSLPALISQLPSLDSRERGKQHQIWKEIPGLQTTCSTPLSIRGSLLAVGGMDRDRKAVTAIHLYQPDTGEWVKVGRLANSDCTCAMITDTEMLVAGGRDDNYDITSRCDIALINAP